MKDHMRKFVLALALLSSTTAAFAQQQQQTQGRSGTAEEQAACNRDVQRHCRSVIDQGDFTILACLKENRSKISAACNQVLKNHGQ
jgi:cysteine rich repeat protein